MLLKIACLIGDSCVKHEVSLCLINTSTLAERWRDLHGWVPHSLWLISESIYGLANDTLVTPSAEQEYRRILMKTVRAEETSGMKQFNSIRYMWIHSFYFTCRFTEHVKG